MNDKSNEPKKKVIKNESAEETFELFIPEETEKTTTEKLPTVKRLVQTLDKFLTRRFLSLIGLYSLAMVICGSVLIASNTSQAFGGEPGSSGLKTVEVWMYSLMVTFSFVFILLAVRIIAIKKRKSLK